MHAPLPPQRHTPVRGQIVSTRPRPPLPRLLGPVLPSLPCVMQRMSLTQEGGGANPSRIRHRPQDHRDFDGICDGSQASASQPVAMAATSLHQRMWGVGRRSRARGVCVARVCHHLLVFTLCVGDIACASASAAGGLVLTPSACASLSPSTPLSAYSTPLVPSPSTAPSQDRAQHACRSLPDSSPGPNQFNPLTDSASVSPLHTPSPSLSPVATRDHSGVVVPVSASNTLSAGGVTGAAVGGALGALFLLVAAAWCIRTRRARNCVLSRSKQAGGSDNNRATVVYVVNPFTVRVLPRLHRRGGGLCACVPGSFCSPSNWPRRAESVFDCVLAG